jgi:predicted metal-dependent hydrolase
MTIDYKIINQKRKTLSIQIDNGEVIVKAPMRYPNREIRAFIDKKEKWIQKHLDISQKKPCLIDKTILEYF